MIKLAVIGLGKMGLSHLAIANGLDGIEVVAIVDPAPLVGAGLSRITGIRHISDYRDALKLKDLDAVIVATPTVSHEQIVRDAIDRGVHLFCEKPLTLSAEVSRELTALAEQRGLVTQVGYHNRFVACFAELKRLVDLGAAGRISHALGEVYGPVVTRPAKATWRGKAELGGGALMDYAAHPINLLNWYLGEPTACDSAVLSKIFSKGVEDEVYASLRFGDVSAQLSVNWSDSSQRKMTNQVTIWGDKGKLYADRQELRVFFWDPKNVPEGYTEGWNVRYTTDLTKPVEFYIRGEEYSAQLETFRDRVAGKSHEPINTFADAAVTDTTIHMIKAAAAGAPAAPQPIAANSDRGGLLCASARPVVNNVITVGSAGFSPWRKCRILNAWVDDLTVDQVVDRLDEGILWTLNPDHLFHLQRNRDFLNAYRQASIVSSDSKYVYWGLKFLGRRIQSKASGSDIVPAYWRRHANNPEVSIYLLGAKPGIAEQARQRINGLAGRDIVVGALGPSMNFVNDEAESAEAIRLINDSRATCLIVGLGAPKQEVWIARYRHLMPHVRVYMGVGATIDYEAEAVKRAPRWMTQNGLEWVYRMATEPRRYWRRYTRQLEFLGLVLLDRFGLYRPPAALGETILPTNQVKAA